MLNMIKNRDYNIDDLLDLAARTALKAGEAIMEVYRQDDMAVEMKSDNSPVTAADLRADAIISSALAKSGLPVLSEEGEAISFKERQRWKLFWLVDPLDGTKEFIDRNGEFTVNIALIQGQVPVAGVVYIPVSDILYAGISGAGAMRFEGASGITGAFKITGKEGTGERTGTQTPARGVPLPCAVAPGYNIVGSRSFMDENTLSFIEEFCGKFAGSRMITRGGALKLCMIAEGTADIYPRFSNISEWDTAAGHAIITASGGFVVQAPYIDQPLVYNKEHSSNPWFIAFRDRELLSSVSGMMPSPKR
jgi:3'(2'), 5'-bisphosphate nucleotidase